MSDKTWYSSGLSFECTQCGRCCGGAPGFVWVDENEVKDLADHLELSIDEFERRFVRRVGTRNSLVEYPDGDCIFLDPKTRGCTVYSVRPIQCRTWPFWNSNLESKESWDEAARDCPGCNQGKVYSLTHIERQRAKKDV